MALEKIKIHLESITKDVKDISQIEFDLLKVRVIKSLSLKYSDILSALIIQIIIAISFFLLTITAALFLGDLFGKMYLGFAAITFFYFTIILVLIVFKKYLLRRPIRNSFIKNIFE